MDEKEESKDEQEEAGDALDLAEVGAKIVALGTKLKGLRRDRDKLIAEITELEGELNPLVARHAELIAEIVGKLAALPVATPTVGLDPNSEIKPANSGLKARVMRFLENADPGVSARDIADALKVDDYMVREVMREMAERQGNPGNRV